MSGNHIYAKDGTYNVTVAPVDIAGATATATTTATITDAPGQSATGAPALSGVEGSSISGLVANFIDPNNAYGDPSQFTATVNWGDGTPTTTGTINQLSYVKYTVSGSHAYAEKGTYTATVSIGDDGGTPVTATTTVTVTDAPITVTGTTLSGVEASPLTGVVANISDPNTLGTAADFTATINWGDGTALDHSGTVTGSAGHYAVNGTHTYATAVPSGSYTITVVVNDVGGSTGTASSTANIAYAPGCIVAGTVHADAQFQMPAPAHPGPRVARMSM